MRYFNNRYVKYKSIIALNIIGIFILISCKKLVQIPLPTDRLVTQTVFSDNTTANQAAVSIYGTMAANGDSYYMSMNSGLLADEFVNYSSGSTQIDFYQNSMNSAMSTYISDGCWGDGYKYIYQANAIIEGLQNNNSISAVVANRLTGEAKFIRAFWHFYLTLCYGDVPVATSTDYTVNTKLKRSSRADVFKLIVADLKEAKALLADDFLDATDTAVTSERLRPNAWAARALLARAYLYTQNYDSAAMEAGTVINHTALFNLNNDLNGVFLANSTEAIWQIANRLPSSINTYDGFNFILITAPQSVSLSTLLLNSFEPGDNRLTNWTDSVVTPLVYYYPYKYKVREGSDPTVHTEHVMVLRLAEQYLIRAEARAQQDDVAGAVEDLNVIRHRAGLGDYSGPTNNKDSVLAAILHERQVELFTEWGHRWFDLARTNQINAVMDSVAPMKGGTWDPTGYQQLFPIPQAEMLVNPNLTQNPGYF